jgi:hypothetical protein
LKDEDVDYISAENMFLSNGHMRKSELDFDNSAYESFDHCGKKRRIDVQDDDVFSSKFLNLPSEDEVKDCYRAFFEATSNNGLQTFICAICARESDIVNGETIESCKCISLLDIRHRERLRPIECVFFWLSYLALD